jgi:hypothetical protein
MKNANIISKYRIKISVQDPSLRREFAKLGLRRR